MQPDAALWMERREDLHPVQSQAPGDTGMPLLATTLTSARLTPNSVGLPSSKETHCAVTCVNSLSESTQTRGPKETGERVSQRAWTASVPEGFEDKTGQRPEQPGLTSAHS